MLLDEHYMSEVRLARTADINVGLEFFRYPSLFQVKKACQKYSHHASHVPLLGNVYFREKSLPKVLPARLARTNVGECVFQVRIVCQKYSQSDYHLCEGIPSRDGSALSAKWLDLGF
jgi:hypothetical protein